MKIKKIAILLIFLWTCTTTAQPFNALTLWDDKPAKDWMTQYYPIGNGRLGAMLSGGVTQDHIQFNEQSLWTGDEQETGAYQAFGDVFIDFDHPSPAVKSYSRSLNLREASHHVKYQSNGHTFQRCGFANHPDNVLVFTYKASAKGAYSGRIRLIDAHGAIISGDNDALHFSGQLENKLRYGASLKIKHIGGTVGLQKDENNMVSLEFKAVDSFTLYLVASTDYSPLRSDNWRAGDPIIKNKQTLDNIFKKSDEQLFKAHMADYQALFNRFNLSIGKQHKENNIKTTVQRIIDYKEETDPSLETLLLQYGRYLLISSSRKGGLPANLQGLWNNSNTPPWRSDYHSNINVQMNYWPAEVSNLAECHVPYLEYIQSMREVKKQNTQVEFPGVRGWTVRTENNIFGGESFSWNTPGSAWYAQALWEHYAFNHDKEYLKNFAYPILKEICEFWDDHLKHRDDGTIVAPNGWSPEHGPTEDGVSHDQQIIYDLFTNYVEACDSLQIDPEYRNHIATLRDQLLKPKIGRWGQLQEWETDRDDPEDKHRHVSHLFALHPGRQISVNNTPELAEAARVSLTARGDESTGWSMAWKMNFWARLQDGNHAYTILHNFITLAASEGVDYDSGGGVYENLLCAHPPFQIDGNLGYVAGVCEMLVQSQEGFIDLLPAVPDQWKSKGEVSGLRARGDITVDMTWKDGKVVSYRLTSSNKKNVKIKINGNFKDVIVSQL
ncbi:glycoside hydrolase family 95 protein [Sphingobacterium corticibacterium]|uniref:Glycoside hydrolase family 95 protein n=1 Tax=Sphingobacterium corticibacterium TaxID=2484746 RepID=A0A4Q6XGT1_9SPHI|nr:glycoside hydrolase family 95 protein [Sphingobacterium corticibacterium]RZF58713.1 glycoside hydrolase family 95 protein [Sphingobacterium corticibacterium]